VADRRPAFAVWLTGPPAAGKSTVAAALDRELHRRGCQVVALESDALRRILTPRPTYDESERNWFYHALVGIGRILVESGTPVIFDATANRRSYRDRARADIDRFVEVLVDCPQDIRVARDPKGLYRQAAAGATRTLPGAQVDYEPPTHPDLVCNGNHDDPAEAARRITELLESRGYL